MPVHLETGVLRDRFRGTLLGIAVGEALGAPADFLTTDQIVERYGLITEMLGGGCHDLQPGQTTDATDMMLCLAESLATIGGFDAEDVMDRYLAWFDSVPLDMSLAARPRDPRRPDRRHRQPHALRAGRSALPRRRRDAPCRLAA